jgi:hypothetical protein
VAERQLPDDPVRFIGECLQARRILWTYHVNMRLGQRPITRHMIIGAVASYEIVEVYPDDKYFPSYLLLGRTGKTRSMCYLEQMSLAGMCESSPRIIRVLRNGSRI